MASPDVVTRFTTGLAVSWCLHLRRRAWVLEALPRVVTLLTACGALVLLPLLLLCRRQQARRDLGRQAGLLVVTHDLAERALMHRVNRVRSTDSIV